MKRIVLIFTLWAIAAAQPDRSPLVDRVGSTGFLQVEAGSFQKLSPKERELAYWLSEASIAIDPIIYDQLSRFGLRQKHLLEMIVAQPAAPARMVAFTKLFWANRGNHNENTAQKFLPEFSLGELKEAARASFHRGGSAWYAEERTLLKELDDLRPSFFDPEFEPMITSKTPRAGMDIIQASSNIIKTSTFIPSTLRFTAIIFNPPWAMNCGLNSSAQNTRLWGRLVTVSNLRAD